MFDLSIIIPVFNNVHFTKNAIQDLMRLPSNYEIVIVDNNSTDETPFILNEVTAQQPPELASVVYIRCPRNLGFGRANNKGYKHCRGDNVLFLNNDIRVRSDFKTWPEAIVEKCKAGKMVSPNGGMLDGKFNFIAETNDLRDNDRFYLSGWCLAASRQTFDSLILNHYSHDETDVIMEGKAWGPWNEKFFAYFEDGDLTWRAKDKNVPLEVVQVPVTHFGRVTGRKVGISDLYQKSLVTFREVWSERMVK